MIDELLIPFSYNYMINAMWVSALVGGVCAFLSAYLMLKGWSLIGDALSHAIVPGVALTYIFGLPLFIGALFSGGLAAGAMLFLKQRTNLKEDAVIGLIFSSFFGLGLFIASMSPASVDIKTITLGNILAIAPSDKIQLVLISSVSLAILLMKWKDLKDRKKGYFYMHKGKKRFWNGSQFLCELIRGSKNNTRILQACTTCATA